MQPAPTSNSLLTRSKVESLSTLSSPTHLPLASQNENPVPNEVSPKEALPATSKASSSASDQHHEMLSSNMFLKGRSKRRSKNAFLTLANIAEESQKKFLLTIKILFLCLQQEQLSSCESLGSEAQPLRQRAKAAVERFLHRTRPGDEAAGDLGDYVHLQQDIRERLIKIVGIDRWRHAESCCDCYWKQVRA